MAQKLDSLQKLRELLDTIISDLQIGANRTVQGVTEFHRENDEIWINLVLLRLLILPMIDLSKDLLVDNIAVYRNALQIQNGIIENVQPVVQHFYNMLNLMDVPLGSAQMVANTLLDLFDKNATLLHENIHKE